MTTGRVEFINPEGLNRNPAFTNVVVVSGPVRTIYVGGQDAVTAGGEVAWQGRHRGPDRAGPRESADGPGSGRRRPRARDQVESADREGQSIEQGYAAFQRAWGSPRTRR